MRLFYWVILLVAQVWLACQLAFAPVDVIRTGYRREERVAALKAHNESPSATTQMAVLEELRRATRHVQIKQFATAAAIFGVLVVLDVLCVYGWRRVAQTPVTQSQN